MVSSCMVWGHSHIRLLNDDVSIKIISLCSQWDGARESLFPEKWLPSAQPRDHRGLSLLALIMRSILGCFQWLSGCI